MTASPDPISPHRLARQATFTIERRFEAPPALVWACFTDCRHVGHWWGPAEFTVTHCAIDLRPGGRFHYALESPNGTLLWGKWDYQVVEPPRRLIALAAFSDATGGITRNPWSPYWALLTHCRVGLEPDAAGTRLLIEATPCDASEHEAGVFLAGHPGMAEGYGALLARLVTHLHTL